MVFVACQSKPPLDNEHLYFNGEILTMEVTSPPYVETLAERDGKIVFVGFMGCR